MRSTSRCARHTASGSVDRRPVAFANLPRAPVSPLDLSECSRSYSAWRSPSSRWCRRRPRARRARRGGFSRALPLAHRHRRRALARAGQLDLAHPPPLDAQDHCTARACPRCPHSLWRPGRARVRGPRHADDVGSTASRGRAPQHVRCARGRAGRPPRDDERSCAFARLQPELARWPAPAPALAHAAGRRAAASLRAHEPARPHAGSAPSCRRSDLTVRCTRSAARSARLSAQLFPDATTQTLRAELTLALLDEDALGGEPVLHVRGPAARAAHRFASPATSRARLQGVVAIGDLARWWPHTHARAPVGGHARPAGFAPLGLGQVGFREVVLERGIDGRGFALRVNGVPVFARGACFLTSDFVSLGEEGLAALLAEARGAGMNMLRVPGIAAYPPPAFHQLCDALGLMVFQDFMFANLDYPAGDPAFDARVESEARELLARMDPARAPPFCGRQRGGPAGGDAGLRRRRWQSTLFDAQLPALAEALAPAALYVAHTPSGGALPFHSDEGLAHYYGVGAYLRPLDDLRRSRVRFASECLACEPARRETTERFMRDLEMPFHIRAGRSVCHATGVSAGTSRTFATTTSRPCSAWSRGSCGRATRSATSRSGAPRAASASSPRSPSGAVTRAAVAARCCLAQGVWPGAGFGVVDADGLPSLLTTTLPGVHVPVLG